MSCKNGHCEDPKQSENICCALCDFKDTCSGFCSCLNAPDDCSDYTECSDFTQEKQTKRTD